MVISNVECGLFKLNYTSLSFFCGNFFIVTFYICFFVTFGNYLFVTFEHRIFARSGNFLFVTFRILISVNHGNYCFVFFGNFFLRPSRFSFLTECQLSYSCRLLKSFRRWRRRWRWIRTETLEIWTNTDGTIPAPATTHRSGNFRKDQRLDEVALGCKEKGKKLARFLRA